MKRIQHCWAGQVEAEYRSAAITAQLLHWLIAVGVAPDTLTLCHRIVADELAHAQLARETLLAAGGSDTLIPIQQATLFMPLDLDKPVILQALGVVAEVFCCGETVAVPLFDAMRREATVPEAVATFDRIRIDEAVHRAFGWRVLDELLSMTGSAGSMWLSAQAPAMVERMIANYTSEDATDSAEARSWGVMPLREYTRIAHVCADEVIRPRFAKRGVSA